MENKVETRLLELCREINQAVCRRKLVMAELLEFKCPWCGGRMEYHEHGINEVLGYSREYDVRLMCLNCSASGPGVSVNSEDLTAAGVRLLNRMREITEEAINARTVIKRGEREN